MPSAPREGLASVLELRLIPVPRSAVLLLHLSFPRASTPPMLQFIHLAILEPRGWFCLGRELFTGGEVCCSGLCSTRCYPVGSKSPWSSINPAGARSICTNRIPLLRADFGKKAPPSLSPTRGEDLFLTALLKTTLKAFLCSGRKQTPA